MPLDAPVIACLAREIHRKLPLKIDKIHQPHSDELLFTCFGMGESLKLLISLNAKYGRIHFFDGSRENPVQPSAFCMLLRKHFGGAKLVAAAPVPFERIIQLTFEVYDQYAGLSKKRIWLELTGKTANLIIAAENGTIIDAWRKTSPSKPGEREIAAGTVYEAPPTGGRWQPVSLSGAEFLGLLNQLPEAVTIEQFLLKHWYGLSALAVREIAAAAGLEPETACSFLQAGQSETLFAAFAAWAERVAAGRFEPTLLYDAQGRPLDCFAFGVDHPPAGLRSEPAPGMNEAVDRVINDRHETARFLEIQQGLLRKIRQMLDKTRLKLAKQRDEADQAERGDLYRIRGELLITYGSQIAKGAAETRLVNYYDPDGGELLIPLNPALSPLENAQLNFKRYQKAKKGQQAIAVQIARTEQDLEYLETVETMILNAETPTDLRLVQEELEPKPVLAKQRKQPGKKELPVEPRRFTTPAGHTLLVGRNNYQNDKLTFKTADPTDWWFHTQKIPGSHVILRPKPGTPVDDEAFNLACQVAVFFSKARQSTKVPVDYTQRKNVKKPPGSKPGYVIYDFFRTAIITPESGLLSELGVTGADPVAYPGKN